MTSVQRSRRRGLVARGEITATEALALVRRVQRKDREPLLCHCYGSIVAAQIDVAWAREHEECPLVMRLPHTDRLAELELVTVLVPFVDEIAIPGAFICIRTHVGNIIAEILGRQEL